MRKNTLIKYLDNRYTKEELKEVIQWIKKEALSEKSKNLVFEDWENFRVEADFEDDEKFSILFDKIQHEIDLYSKNKIKKSGKLSLFVFTGWLTRAAAILFIPVLGFLLYSLSQNGVTSAENYGHIADSVEIVTPVGSRTVVQLSDGTEVHLNYGSSLKYPRVFVGATREVTLSGEGYFDVSHNPDKPFIVKTTHLNIRALGTSFNVKAYEDDETVETTLIEGTVSIEGDNFKLSSKKNILLKPNQKALYYKGKKDTEISELNTDDKNSKNRNPSDVVEKISHKRMVIATKIDTKIDISWIEGELILQDIPMDEVVKKIGRWYNVDVELEDIELTNFTYTATFKDETLLQALELLKLATPIEYSYSDRQKINNDIYTKRKVKIWLKKK